MDLLSRYDPHLKSHLDNDNDKMEYMSPQIQNEIVELASTHRRSFKIP